MAPTGSGWVRAALAGALAWAHGGCAGVGSPEGSVRTTPRHAPTADRSPDGDPRLRAVRELLLDVECRDVLGARGLGGWEPDAQVVWGRLPEPGPHDRALPLGDAARAGLPVAALPASAVEAPCRPGPPDAEEESDGLTDFVGGVLHVDVRAIDDGPGDTVDVEAVLVADAFGTRQRFGARYRLAPPEPLAPGWRVRARRSWLERTVHTALDAPAVTYDAAYFAGLDLGAARARARGDLDCAVARLTEGQRLEELFALLDELDHEARFPFWSAYVHAAEATGRFVAANRYRAWVGDNADPEAARRAAVGGLVDRCLRGAEGEPMGAGAPASDGPCSDEERAALAAGTAPDGLFCHPAPLDVARLTRAIRGAVEACTGGDAVGLEIVALLEESGRARLGSLGRTRPGTAAEPLPGDVTECARDALADTPPVPFRLRRDPAAPRAPSWLWHATWR